MTTEEKTTEPLKEQNQQDDTHTAEQEALHSNGELNPPKRESIYPYFFHYLASSECRTLPNYKEIASEMRMTPKGLFLSEDILGTVEGLFQVWKKTSDAQDLLKNVPKREVEHLFPVKYPPLYYISVGKNTLAGHLVPYQTSSPQGFKLAVSAADPMSASTFLHPRDPLIQRSELLEIVNKNERQKYVVEVQEIAQKLAFGESLIDRFISILENSVALKKRYPLLKRSRRDQLLIVAKFITGSHQMTTELNERFIVPSNRAKDKQILLKRGKVRFVIDSEGTIVDCFEYGSRSFGDFVLRAFSQVTQQFWSRERSLGSKAGMRDRGLFFVHSGNDRLLISLPALRDFTYTVLMDTQFLPQLSSTVTYEEILRCAMNFFAKSIWVMNNDVSSQIQERFRGKLSYRKNGDAVLAIEQRSRVVGFSSPYLLKNVAQKRTSYSSANKSRMSSGAKQGNYKKKRDRHEDQTKSRQ